METWTERSRVKINPIVNSATAGAGASGVYETLIPLSLAAIKSTLSNPMPTRDINLRLGALSITFLVIVSVPAISASISGISSINSFSVSLLLQGLIK